jgi:SAM-dependent methyltransferase
LEHLLRQTRLPAFFRSLGADDAGRLLAQVEHFTVAEAERRDARILEYFGQAGVNQLVERLAKELVTHAPAKAPDILDVGAGSGALTIPIMRRVHRELPSARFYALDVTPAMLRAMARRAPEITPFLGLAENIAGSLAYANQYLPVPDRFDLLLSTLALHHSPNILQVFASMAGALNRRGSVVLTDLMEHTFAEFREEMGDYHLGFQPAQIEAVAGRFFAEVKVQPLPDITCSAAGRAVSIFLANLGKPHRR